MKKILFYIILLNILTSCGSDALSNSKAEKILNRCLEKEPMAVTDYVRTSKMGLYVNDENDTSDFAKYQALSDEGYIKLKDLESKAPKTKDIFAPSKMYKTFTIELTEKSKKYIVDEKRNRVKVKMFEYVVDEVLEVQELPASNSAIVKVQFEAEDITPFATLHRKDPSEYLIQSITMRKTSNGWKFCEDY